MKQLLEIFLQEGEPEFGIPPHWCVKYLEDGESFVDYSYHETFDEAKEWAAENCYINF